MMDLTQMLKEMKRTGGQLSIDGVIVTYDEEMGGFDAVMERTSPESMDRMKQVLNTVEELQNE